MAEAKIEKVAGGVEIGTRMKIKGGKYYGLNLKDLPASAVRQEEVRYNSESGREEPMVTVTVPFSDGRQSLPLDMPRRHLHVEGDTGRAIRRIAGRLFGIIRNGKYVNLDEQAAAQAKKSKAS